MTWLVVMSLLALIIVALVLILTIRAFKQRQKAKLAAIDSSNGIDEGRFIKIGGVDQWITIRGQDRSNPVLLILDGGPGFADSPSIPSSLENKFTIVCWDQPGAGRTFGRARRTLKPGLSVDTMAEDGIAISTYIRSQLQQGKIGILAYSFGTAIGIQMVKKEPTYFYTYVGAGQMVNMQRAEVLNYAHVIAKAQEEGNHRAIRELQKSGSPPYTSQAAFRTQRKWAANYENDAPHPGMLALSTLVAPRYSLMDVFNWFSGFIASQNYFFGKKMDGPAMAIDLLATSLDFEVPIFVFQGTEDDYTPYELAAEYVDRIRAPEKLLVTIEGAGHLASVSHLHVLEQFLFDHVRPLGAARQLSAHLQ